MTSSHDNFINRPFEHLGRLLKRKTETPLPVRKLSKPSRTDSDDMPDTAASERLLFLNAVQDVTPIQHNLRSAPPTHPKRKMGDSLVAQTQEPYQQLKRLVASGEGFIISQTPEYMEGTGDNVPRGITEYLHQGRFSIQDHLDLHGMGAAGAQAVLERFLQRVTAEGLRSVLVIHGRGLSSPGEPVLKARLRRLLVSNRWRKWILAFSSARSCDGGTGATYILLRKKPLPKKKRKKPGTPENPDVSENG